MRSVFLVLDIAIISVFSPRNFLFCPKAKLDNYFTLKSRKGLI
jgi:hypothetical protein